MSRLLYQQGTQQQAENIIVREQKDFSGGLIKDVSDIPDNAVAGLGNFINRGTYLECRSGSIKYSDAALPVLDDSDERYPAPYTASKTGKTITILSASDFSSADVGNFFVWPDGSNDCIVDVVNSTTLTVESSDERGTTTGCNIRGKVNCLYFHKI